MENVVENSSFNPNPQDVISPTKTEDLRPVTHIHYPDVPSPAAQHRHHSLQLSYLYPNSASRWPNITSPTLMGQNSSQPVAVEEHNTNTDSARKSKKRKMKKSKRKSAEHVTEDIDEEESARALMAMRDEDVNQVQQEFDEYDLAASSQLVGDENLPSQSSDIAKGGIIRKKRKSDRPLDKKNKKRRKSRGSSTLQDENPHFEVVDEATGSPAPDNMGELPFADQSDWNWNVDLGFEVENWDTGLGLPDSMGELQVDGYPARDGNADMASTEVNDVPPSTLDAIASDEEDIASFLREIEGATETRLPDLGFLEEEHDDDKIPRSSMPASSPKSHRDKRAQVSHDSPVTRDWDLPPSSEADLGLEQTRSVHARENGDLLSTGQHAPNSESIIDFEAFDNCCAAYGLGSADILGEPSEDQPRTRQSTIEDSDNTTPRSRKRKRKQKLTRSEQRLAEAEYIPLSGSHDPDLLNDEQSDHVFPGLEERQRLSSQSAYISDLGQSINAYPVADKASRVRRSPEDEEESRTAGKFTIAEISKLEKYRDDYCTDENINSWQFNELIHAVVREKPKAKAIWQGMYELIPYRKKVTIQRFCRRRFHNYQVRGAWNEEDDRALARAVEEKGKSWVAVGQIMERHPEDVRDRWRNYHVNAEKRNKEQWTDLEIHNLATAIHDCMQTMKDARRATKLQRYEGRDVPESETESDLEAADAKLLNWQIVSDRMGGTRSRLQCSFKWGKLKDENRAKALKEINAAREGLEATEDDQPAEKKKQSWRTTRAQKRVQEMRPGDVYDFLQALSTCQAAHDGNIPWKSLGDERFRKQWTVADRKGAWAMFKGSVLGAEDCPYQEIVNHLLNNLLANEGDRLGEKWDPDVHGYGQAPPPRTHIVQRADPAEKRQKKLKQKKQKRMAEKGPSTYHSKAKSEVFVAATDDEEEDQASITRSSNASSHQAPETADTSVDVSGEEDSRPRHFDTELADRLKQSLA